MNGSPGATPSAPQPPDGSVSIAAPAAPLAPSLDGLRGPVAAGLARLAGLGAEIRQVEASVPVRAQTVALAGVVVLALAVRLWLLATTSFPINDGGLFARFVDVIAAQFPRLPAWAPFNGYNLPFAYPPLSFWMAAAVVKLGAPTLSVLHVAPILMNMAYLLLVTLLLLRMGYSRLFAAVALLLFATSFRSFEWLVMGGGLSRGLGSLFTLASLVALHRPDRTQPRIAELVFAGACVGGAVLSHLEWGLLAATSSLLGLALLARSPRMWVGQSLAVGLPAVAVVLPWAIFVYRDHGLAPFMAASQTSDWYNGWKLGPLFRAWWITRGQNGAMLPFVFLGLVAAMLRRRLFWIGFLVLCLFLTPRQGPTPAAIGFAVLAAEGLFLLVAALTALSGRQRLAVAAAGVLLLVAGAARNQWSLSPDTAFQPLSPPERSAMAWIARYQPRASFAVVTKPAWEYDRTAEWFPYLTPARSTTTVQGTEWLPGGAFKRMTKASGALKEGVGKSCRLLLGALQQFPAGDFVLTEQRPDCFRTAGYRLVWDQGDVSIWRPPAMP